MIKDKISIFENIITKEEQLYIQNTLLNTAFPWYFVKDITLGKKEGNQNRSALQHIFIQNEKENSPHINLLSNIVKNTCNKINKKLNLINGRTFLQFPIKSKTSIDTPHIDLLEKHTVFLYYVLDSDGETVLYNYKSKNKNDIPIFNKLKEKQRIKPKKGTVVVFNGLIWHTAEQPTKNIRCIINLNLK